MLQTQAAIRAALATLDNAPDTPAVRNRIAILRAASWTQTSRARIRQERGHRARRFTRAAFVATALVAAALALSL